MTLFNSLVSEVILPWTTEQNNTAYGLRYQFKFDANDKTMQEMLHRTDRGIFVLKFCLDFTYDKSLRGYPIYPPPPYGTHSGHKSGNNDDDH